MKLLWTSPVGSKTELLQNARHLLQDHRGLSSVSVSWLVPGRFPLILDESGAVQREAFEYLHDLAVVRGASRSSSTVRTYAESLLLWFQFLEQRRETWCSPRRSSLSAFRNSLMERRGVRGRAANSTVNLRLRAVLGFYEFHSYRSSETFLQTILGIDPSGHNKDASQKNPRTQARRLMLRGARRRPRALTEAQAQSLYVNLRGVYQLMFTWAIATGLRRSSLTALRLADIPGGENTLTYISVSAKGGVVVDVPVTRRLLERTRRYIDSDRIASQSRRSKGSPSVDALFLDSRGQPVSSSGYYQAFRRAAKRANLAATPHMTRHTFATRLHAGLSRMAPTNPSINPLKIVQHWLGHRRAETTELYLEEIVAPTGDVLRLLEEVQAGDWVGDE